MSDPFLEAFYDKLKTRPAISKKDLPRLKAQEVNQIFHGKHETTQMPIIEQRKNFFQVDTTFYPLKGKTRAIFTAIEVNLKLGFLRAYKGSSPTAQETVEHIKELLSNFPVEYIGADNGSEFTAKIVQDFLEKEGIQIYYYTPYNSNEKSIIERFNSTVKNFLNKITHTVADDWTKHTEAIWRAYNAIRHSAIKKAPDDMTEEDRLNYIEAKQEKAQEYLQLLRKFEPGMKVRVYYQANPKLSEKEKQTEKKFGSKNYPRWSKEIYEVDKIDGYKIRLVGLPMRFSPRDLQVVTSVETKTKEVGSRKDAAVERKSQSVRNELGQSIKKIITHQYQTVESNGKQIGFKTTFLTVFEGSKNKYNITFSDIKRYDGKDAFEDYIDTLEDEEREKVMKYL